MKETRISTGSLWIPMNENESANAINLCHVRRATCVSVPRSCCGLIIVQNHHPDQKYNDLALWDYTGLPATFGCRDWFTARAATNVELDKAMEKASQHLSQHSPVRHRTICSLSRKEWPSGDHCERKITG